MNPNKWEFFDDNDFASYDSLLLYHPKHDHTPKLHILSTADINEWKKHFSGINVEIVADLRPHEAWAAWCADNATLYFGYGDVPFKGETYLGHTVTDVWSGIKVTGEPTGIGGTRPWNDIRRNIENVVFDKSFAEARPISCKNWFLNFTSLESVTGLEYLNTSWVISMYQMFNNSYSLKTLDLSTFDVSNVSNMDYMFSNSRSLTTIYASTDWNMGQVKDSYRMFHDCLSLKGVISYDETKTGIEYANPITGYFLNKWNVNVEESVFGSLSVESVEGDFYTNATIKVTCTPINLCSVDAIIVTGQRTGTRIPVSNIGNDIYTFSMPAEDVTVSAVFITPTPFAVYCADAATLYFDCDFSIPVKGDTYHDHTVTGVWSGNAVAGALQDPETPWYDMERP